MTNPNSSEIARLRRRADQHWEMAGLARQDGDHADEIRYTAKARELEKQLSELKPRTS